MRKTSFPFLVAMTLQILVPAMAICVGTVAADEFVPIADLLPPPTSDPDDIEAVLHGGALVVMGTTDDDKIDLVIKDDRIRVYVNGDREDTIREHDVLELLAQTPEDHWPTLYLCGDDGDDFLTISVDIDDDEEPMNRMMPRVVVLGGDGDDLLWCQAPVAGVYAGGLGEDVIISESWDLMGDYVIGGDLQKWSLTGGEVLLVPDLVTDHIQVNQTQTRIVESVWLKFPTVHSAPKLQTINPNPINLIASRQDKNDIPSIPEPTSFDTLLLERENVSYKVGYTSLAYFIDDAGQCMGITETVVD